MGIWARPTGLGRAVTCRAQQCRYFAGGVAPISPKDQVARQTAAFFDSAGADADQAGAGGGAVHLRAVRQGDVATGDGAVDVAARSAREFAKDGS